MLENLVFQELRRRGRDIFTYVEPDGEVDFLVRDGRKVAGLIQVCASLDTDETTRRELRALHKAAAATKCSELLLLTYAGEPPPPASVPAGPPVTIKPVWEWLLEDW